MKQIFRKRYFRLFLRPSHFLKATTKFCSYRSLHITGALNQHFTLPKEKKEKKTHRRGVITSSSLTDILRLSIRDTASFPLLETELVGLQTGGFFIYKKEGRGHTKSRTIPNELNLGIWMAAIQIPKC